MLDLAPQGAAAKRLFQRVLAAAGLASAAVLVASCNLILGAGDYKVSDDCPTGGCATTCGFTFAAAPCGACVQSSCCAEAQACHDDANCKDLYDCVVACAPSDGACLNACSAAHQILGNQPAKDLEACLSESARCGNACSSCGAVAQFYADTCGPCVEKTCCESSQACADDPVCAERARCIRACTSSYPSCVLECDAAVEAASPSDDARARIAKLDTCTSKGCGKQCAYGAHWGCVGQFTWPAATDDMIDVTFRTDSFTDSSVAVPDVTILACLRTDLACADPIAMGTTDATGAVTISIPSGFTGFFDATAPGLMHALAYVAWPVTAAQRLEIPMGTYDLYKSLVMSGGGMVDDTKGALFVFTYDCLQRSAPGVGLDLDPESNVGVDHFFFANGSPVSATDHTDAEGIGGFSNVPERTVTLTAKLVATKQTLAVVTAQVRVQTVTFISLSPTP